MNRLMTVITLTTAIVLMAGCSLGVGNEALQSCLGKARGKCSETALVTCRDKVGDSKASCQKTALDGCMAAAEKTCQQLHPEPQFENGNGGGGY